MDFFNNRGLYLKDQPVQLVGVGQQNIDSRQPIEARMQ